MYNKFKRRKCFEHNKEKVVLFLPNRVDQSPTHPGSGTVAVVARFPVGKQASAWGVIWPLGDPAQIPWSTNWWLFWCQCQVVHHCIQEWDCAWIRWSKARSAGKSWFQSSSNSLSWNTPCSNHMADAMVTHSYLILPEIHFVCHCFSELSQMLLV